MANDDVVRQPVEIPASKPRTTRNPASTLSQLQPTAVPYSRSVGNRKGDACRPPPVLPPYTRTPPRFSSPFRIFGAVTRPGGIRSGICGADRLGSVTGRNFANPNPYGDARAH